MRPDLGRRTCVGLMSMLAFGSAPSPAQEPKDPNILIEKRTATLPAWAEESFRRVDAGYDGWRSEVLHDSAKPILKKFVAALGDANLPFPEKGISSELAAFTALRPKTLAPLMDRDGMQVLHADDWGATPKTMDWELLVAPLREALGHADAHPFVKFVDIQMDDDSFRGKALVHWSVSEADGSQIQINAIWMTDWAADDDTAPKLRGIAVLDYEEFRTPKPLFREVTGHLTSSLGFWEREILTGIDDYHQKVDRLIGQAFIGSQGMAVGDVNGDGRDDIYLCAHGGAPNRLLIHTADGTLRDASESSGLDFLESTRSALLIDLDNDGDQDFVASLGANLLVAYNDGQGRFDNFTPLNGKGFEDIYSLSAADPDKDGDLDLYAVRYVANGIMGGVPTPYNNANNGASNFYWRNDGVGKFVDATEEVGLDHNNSKFSLASIWEDFDGDGDLDLYVANDFGDNNLYLNQDGKFRDVATERGAEDRAAVMGLATSDFDLDGDMDLLITNMFSSAGLRIAPQQQFQGENHGEVAHEYVRHARGNTLLANDGKGNFIDVTETAGIAIAGWSWGSKFADLNNDGYADIYSPNGFLTGPVKDDL
ncbi:MAG: VCBS repeat-containing protein [Planctomycetes bacterium]|nr:VCBS repeat-containing protein [Planctomycetota bacterium]